MTGLGLEIEKRKELSKFIKHNEIISIPNVAKILNVSYNTVKRKIATGDFSVEEALKVFDTIPFKTKDKFEAFVFQKEYSISPRLIMIHYDLYNIERLNDAKNRLKFISAYLHYDMEFCKSEVAHFAIRIPVKENRNVNFYDNKYNNVFSQPFSIFAGVDDSNKPVVIHFNKTPHILIAGTTGSGKSVMLNSAICSILRTATPKNVMFYMIDTKRVELSYYRKLGNNCKVATNVQDGINLLKAICQEMEQRYIYMEENFLKDIPDGYKRITVIIEELGDLMYESKNEVEPYIVKIARLGRACGIHLIMATQRPTVDVCTGSIKANIGCRFALQTTSGTDSRNILGHIGAEKLKGQGDCLLKLAVYPDPLRIQCPYISDNDILKTIENFNGGGNG